MQSLLGAAVERLDPLIQLGAHPPQGVGQVAEVVRASMDGALLLSPDLAEFEEALGTFGQAFGAIMAQRSTPEEAMTWAQRQSKFK